MGKFVRHAILFSVVICALAGCGGSQFSSTMYPEAAQPGAAIKNDAAILIVANGGSQTINYLQFVHSSLPAINARDINLPPGGTVAIPVPVGTTGLSLSNYTSLAAPAGYLQNGSSFGYVPVRTPPIDVASPGVYFVATVLPGQRPNYEVRPTSQQIAGLKKQRPELARLTPVNFSW
jgi:hypothetical protein